MSKQFEGLIRPGFETQCKKLGRCIERGTHSGEYASLPTYDAWEALKSASAPLLAALEEKDRRIATLEQGQQPAGYIDTKCFEGKYPTGGSWSLKPHTTGRLNQVTPFYLAPQKQTLLGYVDMFAIMRMHEGRMSYCALRPEPKGISYVSVYAGDSVAVPKQKLNEGKG